MQEKIKILEQQLASLSYDKTPLTADHGVPGEYVDELKRKVQSQVIAYIVTFSRLTRLSIVLCMVCIYILLGNLKCFYAKFCH